MNIIITIQMNEANQKLNIQVSDKQCIKDTLIVLEENLHVLRDAANISIVQDMDSGRRINTETTYEQAHIYSGCRLLVKENG